MTEYYIVSTKWTYPDSGAFTFWGKDNCGYVLDINRAGIYDCDPKRYPENEGCFVVERRIIDRLKTRVLYDNREMYFVLNKPFFRRSMNLPITKLRGGMTKVTDRDFDVLQMCDGYEAVQPEVFKSEWNGCYRVKAKQDVDEWWRYDEEFQAETRSAAVSKALKYWDYLGLDIDDFIGQRLITCKKSYEDVFKGWQ